MSAATETFYCVGARFGAWTIEALDWRTGAQRFWKPIGYGLNLNSFFAATEIVGPGALAYGTFNGAVELAPRGRRFGARNRASS